MAKTASKPAKYKYFTIRKRDVGSQAVHDVYVHELQTQNKKLWALLQEVADSGVSFEDERIDYKDVQLDVTLLAEIHTILAGG